MKPKTAMSTTPKTRMPYGIPRTWGSVFVPRSPAVYRPFTSGKARAKASVPAAKPRTKTRPSTLPVAVATIEVPGQ